MSLPAASARADRPGKKIVERRHPEWIEHNLRWTWLLDSYEGGDRYRLAEYGADSRGLPVRNLIRHKREYPSPAESGRSKVWPGSVHPGEDSAAEATDSDYDLRLARTPVPTFFREAIDDHLSQIYAREIRRDCPALESSFFDDCDGWGTPFAEWMRVEVAPQLLACGQIDVLLDHPQAPEGETIASQADVRRLGLDRVIARVIRPDSLVWWKTDQRGRYVEATVRECVEGDEGEEIEVYRHWTALGWTLYDDEGGEIEAGEHSFGVVPIVRVFDRKKTRCRNVGQPRYEGVAERMREYYNRDSELILSDTTQAHPLLQGPEDYVQPDGTIPIGPSWLLPMKKQVNGTTTTYTGFEVVPFPKDGADSIRRNKADILADIDRDTKRVKPAGESTTSSGYVEQSGISKSIDHKGTHDLLAAVSATLRRCEEAIIRMALVVKGAGRKVVPGALEVIYPASFELYSASDVAIVLSDFVNLAALSGNLPECEGPAFSRLLRLMMPGMPQAYYRRCDREIKKFLASGGGVAKAAEMKAKLQPAGNVRSVVNDPTVAKQPPGQGGNGRTKADKTATQPQGD